VPDNVLANVEKWRQLNPDFEVLEWNERNVDLSTMNVARQAWEMRRWSFVSNVVRLQKLVEHGGFYLDTDVELIRPLRDLESEGDDFILGYIYDCALGTAVLYSPPGHPLVQELLENQSRCRLDVRVVNNTVFTDYFINNVPDFLLNGRRWQSAKSRISLYAKEFFEQPCFHRERGICIHHASNSWHPANIDKTLRLGDDGYHHKIKWLKRKVKTFISLCRSEYLPAYLRAVFLNRPSKVSMWWKMKIDSCRAEAET